MATLLKIDVSPRGDWSVSRELGKQFVADWQKNYPDGKIIIRDLATTNLPFLDLPWIMGAYSPVEGHTAEQKAALKIGDEFIEELQQADQYLITTPMFNFAIPAILKAWIDHSVRSGKTFSTNPDGSYNGLLVGKKATIIVASAGVYTPGTPAEGYNFQRPYLRHILGFMGVTDVTFIEAGATYKIDRKMATFAEVTNPVLPEIAAAAK